MILSILLLVSFALFLILPPCLSKWLAGCLFASTVLLIFLKVKDSP